MTNKSIDSTATKKASQVAEFLGLKDKGEASFILLCKKGCDAGELGNWFKLLTSKSEVTITRNYVNKQERFATSHEHAERMNQPLKKYNFRSRDTKEDSLGGLQTKQLEQLKPALTKIATKIQQLNNSKLVRQLNRNKYRSEVLYIPELLNYYADTFINMVLAEAKKIGARQRPDYTKFLKGLYKHVRDTTKEWNDALIADVLNEIVADSKDTEQSLKEWRNRHGIIERKVTRKSKNL